MDKALEFALEEDSDLYFYTMMHRMRRTEAEMFEAEAAAVPTSDQIQKSYARFLEKLSVWTRREKRKKWISETGNFMQRVAVFLLIFFIAAGCTAIQVDAIREQLGRWLLNYSSQSVDISNNIDSSDDRAEYEIASLSFAFGWLPDGCYLIQKQGSDDENMGMSCTFKVCRQDETVGEIEIMPSSYNVSLDSEEATIEYPELNGYQQAIYLEKNYSLSSDQPVYYRVLLAQNDECMVYISNYAAENGLSRQEIQQIAESIKFMIF